MKNYSITIIASGIATDSEDYVDRFFEAGCDDATLSVQKGRFILEFDREASSFLDALESAIADVKRAGAKVERIEPDHLVNASDIASRSGISRQAVSLYAANKRSAGFPPPVARLTTDSPLWDWAEVSDWMAKQQILPLEAALEAVAIRRVNGELARH